MNIEALQQELQYTKLQENIEQLYKFITSEEVNNLSDYQKILLESQLNAMNIYRNCMVLRISELATIQQMTQQQTIIEESNDESQSSEQIG